ncbi:unnamed protein product [Schistocephalus solidus]|uniref:Miff domain-containing protein n=1 Tax=Schistocephalus solidus TaxID=70667 RepID=A0A183T2F7_SCHSO|nr:unnamed protein product [Schistocephalus solidus]
MDPLSTPLSDYEWKYRTDINQRMRVPEKLSVDSARSDLISADNDYFSKCHGPTFTTVEEDRLDGCVVPVDLRGDETVASSALTAKAEANASASATVTFAPGASSMDISRTPAHPSHESKDEVMKYAIARISRLEAHVSRLSSHMRMLEQQQVVMGAAISLYCKQVSAVAAVAVAATTPSLHSQPLRTFGSVLKIVIEFKDQLMTQTEITFRGQTRMPTKATKEEEAAKKAYKRHLRIAFIISVIISVVFLAIGIALVVVFRETIQGLVIFGAVLISLGIVSVLVGAISGQVFFRLLRSTSDSVAYYPKTAEALASYPYPRQPGSLRARRTPSPRPPAEPEFLPPPTAPPQPAQVTSTLVAPPEPPPGYAPPAYEELDQKDY